MLKKEISHFTVLEKIDEGGMGKIFLAQDTQLNRKVALKFLPSHLTSKRQLIDRFKREAQAAAALKHPNIVTIYEMGNHEGEFYIAMEYIDGICLHKLIEKKRLSLRKALLIAIQIGRGLRKAHSVGIIHRDVKPANVMIDKDGWVKILDFGLAKLTEHTRITKYGTRMGTAPYISPEQMKGRELGPASDIFSLGVILYQLLTGKHPFAGRTEEEIMYLILKKKPKPLSKHRKGIPSGLQRIIDKSLKKEAQFRYQDVDLMLNDLKRVKRQVSAQSIAKKRKSRKDTVTLNIGDFDSSKIRSGIEKFKTTLMAIGRSAPISRKIRIKKVAIPVWLLLSLFLLAGGAMAVMGPWQGLWQLSGSHSKVMQMLVQAEDTKTLLATFQKLKGKNLISIGNEVDFSLLDHCYLFVFDETEILDIFEVKENYFCSLHSDEIFTSPPNKFSGKNKVWVQDLTAGKKRARRKAKTKTIQKPK